MDENLDTVLVALSKRIQAVELVHRVSDGKWVLRGLQDDGREGQSVEFIGDTPMQAATNAAAVIGVG